MRKILRKHTQARDTSVSVMKEWMLHSISLSLTFSPAKKVPPSTIRRRQHLTFPSSHFPTPEGRPQSTSISLFPLFGATTEREANVNRQPKSREGAKGKLGLCHDQSFRF